MVTHLHSLLLLLSAVRLSHPVCVEIPSATVAELGRSMMLTCIFCKRREELKPNTTVKWYFTAANENPNNKALIFKHVNGKASPEDGPFLGRVEWKGSVDMQNVSIRITNVTHNDSGVYQCHVVHDFPSFKPPLYIEDQEFRNIKNITLKVIEKAGKDSTALYSEIMMYVLLVFLTLWLLIEMVYCYRKISKSDEPPQDTATNYLAVPSEHKDNAAAAAAAE